MRSDLTTLTPEYRQWLGELKTRFRQVQLRAAVAVNTAMLQFYWELGADMVAKQTQFAWGSGFLNQLSADLMREFPEVKGFSKRNLEQIRRWYSFWNASPSIAQQAASQLMGVPWWHHVTILTKCKQPDEALQGQLPSIEQLERELGLDAAGGGDSSEAGGLGYEF